MSNFYCNTNRRFVKVGNKTIGYLTGNRFIKPVVGSRHKLKYPPAWAIDAEAFDNEVKPNATEIVIQDRETGIDYHAPVSTFDRLKGELNRGWGRQYFLTLNHWEERGNGGYQLRLFGGENVGYH